MQITPEVLVQLVRKHQFHFSNEQQLQDGLARVFDEAGVEYLREHDLGESGRIDFYFPEVRTGLEVKVKGNPTAVLRQLGRYAGDPAIASLVLVTSRIRLERVPPCLAGKALTAIPLWWNGI